MCLLIRISTCISTAHIIKASPEMIGPLRTAVHAAQQCADRGLLKFVFVSSDDAFITHMLGMYLSAPHSNAGCPHVPRWH